MPEFCRESLPSAPLYHYTTLSGFLGIVKTQTLWATNLYYMNDAMEMKHAISVACNAFNKYIKTEYEYINSIDRRFSWCAYYCKNKLQELETHPIYACCFSESKDLLSQWRGYAVDCGISLCFESSNIIEISKASGFRLCECIYDLDEQHSIVDRAVQECLELCQHIKEVDDHTILTFELAFQSFLKGYYEWGPLLKDMSFRDEKEWRLLSSIQSCNGANICFRSGKHSLIPYAEINIGIENSDCAPNRPKHLGFSDVIIGPTPQIELSVKAVKQLCESENIFYRDISPTAIPYRPV